MTNDKKNIVVSQSVAILVDGNNIEISLHSKHKDNSVMLNFDTLIPRLLTNRSLNRLIYFREGKNISTKLADRLQSNYHGSVSPCHKSADIPLTIKALQLSKKVDTIIIMSGDSDYIELVRHLKSEGVRVEVASVAETTASILLEEVDYFHPLLDCDCFSLSPSKLSHKKTSSYKSREKSKRKSSSKPSSEKNDAPAPQVIDPII
ncbi:MAG: NYN domain-containing protein [Nitrospinae bacterium]|nr:NYN domain-containing protein [Nitrospinota bacterium]